MPKPRGGLGRGLDALIPEAASGGPVEVPTGAILPNPQQPRQEMDAASLQELAESIAQHGIIQPLVVSRLAGDEEDLSSPRYQLVAGERRWRAARLAGLERVPVVVREAEPRASLVLALVENIQRADLGPLEEAAAYQHLVDDYALSQEEVARQVGRSRATVANALRLLRLTVPIKQALAAGSISEGHARALLGLSGEGDQTLALAEVTSQGLNVRQTEELVRRWGAARASRASRHLPAPEVQHLEDQFRRALGSRVSLSKGRRGGRLVIYFYSDDELQNLYETIVGE